MKKQKKNITPVLLGADLNAYSVALAFYEAYGVTSHAFARYRCGATENSKFIKTHICSGIDHLKIAVPELLKFAKENSDSELILIPCADWYVAMLQGARDELSEVYKIHIPPRELWEKLSDKHSFYQLLRDEGISYPDYEVFSSENAVGAEPLSRIKYPAVVKPTDSTEYWKHPFPDMQKVFFVKNAAEAEVVIKRIFKSGYNKQIVLQNQVGSIAENRVLTTFSDKDGKVVRAVFGEVILEEVGKTSYGNHSAIITVPLNDICLQLIDLLNKIKYVGVANIDIISDGTRDFVLELNTRQGRSCDYLRAAGVNIAELFVRTVHGEKILPDFSYKEVYWHYPPHRTVLNYSSEVSSVKAERLKKLGFEFSPYGNLSEGALRRVYVWIHNVRLGRAIKKAHAENRTEGGRA